MTDSHMQKDDMELIDQKEIVENISYLIDEKDEPALKNILIDVHPADLAVILGDLEEEERRYLFNMIDADSAPDVLAELDEATREDIMEGLTPNRLSRLVEEMDSDDAADVLGELSDEVQEQVLAQIEPEDRADVESLLEHEEDTAGGIMALEFIAVYQDQTVDETIQEIRRRANDIGEVFYIYAIDREGRLVGVVPFKNLLLHDSACLIKTIMDEDVISVTADEDQEDVARLVRKYDLSAVPVVDQQNRLVGRITIDDIVDVLHEEANEDIQRMAGISDEERLHESSALRISRNRLPWLLISFTGELGSALVLNHFDATIEEIIISAFFIPVIMATGGNAGIQSSTIVVRSLALGEGGVTGIWNRVFRELRVALLNGFIIGSLLFTVILLWKHNVEFGLVGGIAMMLVMINSAIFGALVPFALSKFKVDTAIATGPFITTANDIFGLLIYLGMATFYLSFTR